MTDNAFRNHLALKWRGLLSKKLKKALAMSTPCTLVVEEDVHLLEGIRTILELDGYQAMTAENGLQALHALRKESSPPDLIVSDIMMPQMDGVAFLREVRKD